MKEREIYREEYKEIEKHVYKGVHFFTAIYNDHVVLEPVHQEVLDAINAAPIASFQGTLWHDSVHTWARDMTLQAQRNRLVEYAHSDIDFLMSGKILKNQRKDYLEKRKKLRKQWEFFKALRRKKNE